MVLVSAGLPLVSSEVQWNLKKENQPHRVQR
jgi:hypothetical protein